MKTKKIFKLSRRHHILFWFFYFLLNTLRWGNYFDDYLYSLKTNVIGFPVHMILVYLNIFILMPRLVFKRKYFSYIIALIASLLLMVFIKFNLTYYLVSENIWPEGPAVINDFTFSYAIDMMIGELYVTTFVTAIKITMDWLEEQKRTAALEKMQSDTELKFLRTQISPHFFFNTLNNIYSLAIEKSEKTPKIILKLSELMRYLLYETRTKRQRLEKEIICIQNYLELESIRYGKLLDIDMKISGDIMNKKIAPILLLSFVENAFKHGANKNIGNIKIDIDFKIIENFLYFTISNPVPKAIKNKQIIKHSGGIGLKNVKKRLALGYNPDEYELNIESKDKVFIVNLKIKV
jgi:sensor histidine kinase YesM|tara:strand:- start:1164 stop:2213 length:1050 start_codon:yes stop_codon:yes gene_type:complete